MLTLSPMMVAPVCRVGDPLQITCTALVEFIRWSFVVVNEHGIEEEITVSRNSRDPSPPPIEELLILPHSLSQEPLLKIFYL